MWLSISLYRVFKKFLENTWTQLRRSWVSLIYSKLFPRLSLFLQFIASDPKTA